MEALRRHGVPIALATDCNPGSSPCTSLLLMLNMGCTLFRLTPEEALAGVTRNGARALGMAATHGTLEPGKAADFVLGHHPSRRAGLPHRPQPLPGGGEGRRGGARRLTASQEVEPGVCSSTSAQASMAWTRPESTGRMPAARSSRKPKGGSSSM